MFETLNGTKNEWYKTIIICFFFNLERLHFFLYLVILIGLLNGCDWNVGRRMELIFMVKAEEFILFSTF